MEGFWTKELSAIGADLTRHPDGYWATDGSQAVSFPADGHEACRLVEDGSFWFIHRNAVIETAVDRFPPRGAIFDIGGGNGYVSAGLMGAGYRVVTLEPDPVGARYALERGIECVVCSTVEAARFRPRSLSAVGMFDVLEHIEDEEAVLQGLLAALEPGGLIYVTVPAHRALWSPEDDYAGHFRRYTRKSLSECLERAGFTVDYSTYFFWCLPLPVLLLRSIPGRLGVRRAPSLERTQREHLTQEGLASSLLERVLSAELSSMRAGRRIAVGTSCLAVAHV